MDQEEIIARINALPDSPATLNTPIAQREEALELYIALMQTLPEDDFSASFMAERPLNQILDEDKIPSSTSHTQAA